MVASAKYLLLFLIPYLLLLPLPITPDISKAKFCYKQLACVGDLGSCAACQDTGCGGKGAVSGPRGWVPRWPSQTGRAPARGQAAPGERAHGNVLCSPGGVHTRLRSPRPAVHGEVHPPTPAPRPGTCPEAEFVTFFVFEKGHEEIIYLSFKSYTG